MPSYLLHQKKLLWQAKLPFLGSMIRPTRLQLRSLVNITGLISQSQSSIFPRLVLVQLWRLVTKPRGFKFSSEHQNVEARPKLHIAKYLQFLKIWLKILNRKNKTKYLKIVFVTVILSTLLGN